MGSHRCIKGVTLLITFAETLGKDEFALMENRDAHARDATLQSGFFDNTVQTCKVFLGLLLML